MGETSAARGGAILMRQTTLSVPLEVKPASCALLTSLIDKLRDSKEPAGFPDQYARLHRQTPSLHFMSVSVFASADFDALFVLEANFDGPLGAFWGQLEATLGPELREMLRCCKAPLDEDGPLYQAVAAVGSQAPIAPYFEARTQRPSVFHHGNRGLTRDRILQESALFKSTRKALDATDDNGVGLYAGASSSEVHQKLRKALLGDYPWLDQPAPARIPPLERFGDIARLVVFAVTAVFCLSAPGLILALAMPPHRYLVLMGVVWAIGLLISLVIFLRRASLPGTGVPSRFSLALTLLRQAPLMIGVVLVYLLAATAVSLGPAMLITGVDRATAVQETARWVAQGAASIPVSVIVLLAWLRYLERRDSSQDAPPQDERILREMVRREDWIAQNHMGSLVLVKPGVLRSILAHAGHLGLGLFLRVQATNGYLGSMRTVHFAHWAFVNNSNRLMFFSNFDHSWASYLDDFIEKAHAGLTLAWGSGVGFPPTRFLVLDGASHGRQFKDWALASRAVSRFWYSAYDDLTVDQIERQARIALGLRKAKLKPKGADTWLRDL